MWAYELTGPSEFQRVEMPSLTSDDLEDGQVLLRTLAGGICGSDLPLFLGRQSWLWKGSTTQSKPGFPLHEIAGVVVSSRHHRLQPGDRVVGWASGCDALAELTVCEGDELAPYAADLPAEVAVLLQPLACVLYAVDQIGRVDGKVCAVIGLGPIGVLFTHVLASRGAARVIGVDRADKADVCASFGVDEFVRGSSDMWAARILPDERPDILIEAVGHQVSTLTDLVTAAAPEGRIYYFGLPDDPVYPFPLMEFLRKNLTFVSGVTRDRSTALAAAIRYLGEHPDLAHTYVTNTFPIDQVQDAFTAAVRPVPGQVKVSLVMSE